MDDVEHAIFQLGEKALKLAGQTPSEEAQALLRDAERILKLAASAHHPFEAG